MQLFTAIAAHRAENVARGTAGVYADQYGFVVAPLTLDECHVLQTVRLLTERYQTEVAVLGGHVGTVANLYQRLLLGERKR